MRHLRRLLVALALSLTVIPAVASAASAGPLDGSSCDQWVRLVDISGYQTGINWYQVAHAGISGVYIKATEGTYVNPLLNSQRAGAAQYGIPAGFYSYVDTATNPVVAAQAFVAQGGAAGSLPPMIDLEANSGNLSTSNVILWSAYFAGEVKSLTGVTVSTMPLYSGAYYPWSQSTVLASVFPSLFIAAYPMGYNRIPNDAGCSVAGSQPHTAAWPGWSLWQASSVAQIWGIPGNVDIDFATPSWWASVTGGSVSPPSPGTNKYPIGTYGPGSSGAAVTLIQNEMVVWEKAKLVLDGQFGPQTADAVAWFQVSTLHLSGTGVWDPTTQAAFNQFVTNFAAWLRDQQLVTAPNPSVLAFIHGCTTTVLRFGSSGACVTFAQARLEALGWPSVAQDGSFGWATASAVSQIQTSRHLVPDAVIGTATWSILTGH